MILDRHVPALDVASFAEAIAERGRINRRAISRPAVEESDYRRRLLRARRQRPRRRACKPRDELGRSRVRVAKAVSISPIAEALIPEFVGRVPVLATLEDLDEPILKRLCARQTKRHRPSGSGASPRTESATA
jgi:hypothetical protein